MASLQGRMTRSLGGNDTRDYPATIQNGSGGYFELTRASYNPGSTMPIVEQFVNGAVINRWDCTLDPNWGRTSGRCFCVENNQLKVKAITHGLNPGNEEFEWSVPGWTPVGGGPGPGPGPGPGGVTMDQVNRAIRARLAAYQPPSGGSGVTIDELTTALNSNHNLRTRYGNLIISSTKTAIVDEGLKGQQGTSLDQRTFDVLCNKSSTLRQQVRDGSWDTVLQFLKPLPKQGPRS